MAQNNQGKLIIASQKLPITVTREDGKLVYKQSTGGLATGVSTVSKNRDSIWIGWPGITQEEITKTEQKEIENELKKRGFHPIFPTQEQVDLYYSGYCNATLWPLLHYFVSKAEYKQAYWKSYLQVNKVFSQEIRKLMTKDSQVWVHDYQLMLVPQQLRSLQPDCSIGFFLHTSFPAFEIFRLLPQRDDLLRGLLGADLIGFHTYDFVQHFLNSAERLLGYENKLGAITLDGRTVRADSFPLGIDYDKFAAVASKKRRRTIFEPLQSAKSDTKVILSVDRLDYSKGIPARLRSFETFLEEYPQYHGRVVLMMLAIPSRGGIEAYQDLKQDIEQLVSSINGTYATANWSPIHYRHQALPFDEFSALYASADVMLVTPMRDGMNLVAKEYVATHHKRGGVLVLSELAGAASELTEAIQVNPNSYRSVAKAISQALEMPIKEQKERMKSMQQRLAAYTTMDWAEDYLGQLSTAKTARLQNNKLMTPPKMSTLKDEYKQARKRLLLLDYDGTLINFVKLPKRGVGVPSARVKKIVKNLSDDEHNQVMIVSGRPKSSLESFFKNKGLGLIAEHGGWVFSAGTWVRTNVKFRKWKSELRPLLENFTARTAGARLEVKDFCFVWHYREVTPELAFVRKEELKMELSSILEGSEVGVYEGHKVLEIKPRRINKGAVVSELLSQEKWDFIMAIGDDYTDEDMFKVLPSRAHSIHVGSGPTSARHQVDSVKQVLELLRDIPE